MNKFICRVARLTRWTAGWLSKRLRAKYHNGRRVVVDHPTYHGSGIVQRSDDVTPWMVPVVLGNGNVWRYEAWTVKPAPSARSRSMRAI